MPPQPRSPRLARAGEQKGLAVVHPVRIRVVLRERHRRGHGGVDGGRVVPLEANVELGKVAPLPVTHEVAARVHVAGVLHPEPYDAVLVTRVGRAVAVDDLKQHRGVVERRALRRGGVDVARQRQLPGRRGRRGDIRGNRDARPRRVARAGAAQGEDVPRIAHHPGARRGIRDRPHGHVDLGRHDEHVLVRRRREAVACPVVIHRGLVRLHESQVGRRKLGHARLGRQSISLSTAGLQVHAPSTGRGPGCPCWGSPCTLSAPRTERDRRLRFPCRSPHGSRG